MKSKFKKGDRAQYLEDIGGKIYEKHGTIIKICKGRKFIDVKVQWDKSEDIVDRIWGKSGIRKLNKNGISTLDQDCLNKLEKEIKE